MKKKNNILVDMSVVIFHHGHVRLLKKAAKLGRVIVALTTDKEIIKFKKKKPILNYNQRKEIVSAIRYVSKVIPSPFLITENFLKKNRINYLVHAGNNRNKVHRNKTITFKRTKNISATIMISRIRNGKKYSS